MLFLLFFQVGCARPAPAGIKVSSARDLGALRFSDAVTARDGGFSALWEERSVWVFGDTILNRPGEDGESWRSNSWSWSSDLDAADGIGHWSELTDAQNTPRELFPLTPDEQRFNEQHRGPGCKVDCGHRYALWPGPIVHSPKSESSLVFYFKIQARTEGPLDFDIVGTSLAKWQSPETTPKRPEVRPGTENPTLLFQNNDPLLGAGAIVYDNFLYAFGCKTEQLRCPCKLARAPLEKALERTQWKFLTASGTWTSNSAQAAPIFDGAHMMTIHWNGHLKAFLLVYSDPLHNRIVARTAPHPEGPWSPQELLYNTQIPPTPNTWTYSGLAHPELSKQNDQVEYLTYYKPGEGMNGEMRLVEITFAP
jgi:hypothetical protein